MAVCKNCNSELPEGAMFCMKCGAKIGRRAAVGGISEEKKPEPKATVQDNNIVVSPDGSTGFSTIQAAATKAVVQGNKIIVSPDGSTGCSSIQAAVDAASDGMMIEIMPGTYKEHVKIEKSIALVGIADNNGNFPTITGVQKSPLIEINGNANLYRLNLKSWIEWTNPKVIHAKTDSFVYSELIFDGAIHITPVSDDYSDDCEICNCTMTFNPDSAPDLVLFSGKVDPPKNLVKVRDCDFEKGGVYIRYLDVEDCTIGEIKFEPCGPFPFFVKNSKINRRCYFYEGDEAKYVNCTILS